MTAEPPLFHLVAPPLPLVGVRPFTIEGKLHAGVIVKLGLDLRHPVARPIAPAPFALADKYPSPRPIGSITEAADTAPRKRACDVTVTGVARTPGGQPAQTLPVGLAVYRGNVPLLRKAVVAVGPVGPSGALDPIAAMPLTYERALGGPDVAANPVGSEAPSLRHLGNAEHPGCLAPIPAAWKIRKDRLDAATRDSLGTAVPSLPASLDWGYFQAAPGDQIVPFLQGGEWVVIDGVSAVMPRIQTRLPFVDVRAYVVGAGGAPSPVRLAWDTLAIDGESLLATAVFRGDVPSPRPLGETRDVAIVVCMDVSADPPPARGAHAMESDVPAPARLFDPANLVPALSKTARPSLSATEGLSPLEHMSAAHRAVAPFALGAPTSQGAKVAMVPGAPWARSEPPPVAPPAPAQPRTEELRAPAAYRLPSAPPPAFAAPAPPLPSPVAPPPFLGALRASPSAPPPAGPPIAAPTSSAPSPAAAPPPATESKEHRSRLDLAAAGLRRSGMSEKGIAEVLRQIERELGTDA